MTSLDDRLEAARRAGHARPALPADPRRARLRDGAARGAARRCRDYADSIDSSPDRLQPIEDRLAAIARLKRRYGPTLDEVIAKARAIADELGLLGTSAEALVAARAGRRGARDGLPRRRRRYRRRQARPRRRACQGAREGARRARHDRHPLELALHASQPEAEWGPTGVDRLELLLSPNVGEDVRPLARIASGGELSRVMLAIKTLASPDVPGKTLIFDEVDAGIGGASPTSVGRPAAGAVGGCQVFCITHLPQVAAFGDAALPGLEAGREGRTVTPVELLDDEAAREKLRA